MPLLEIEDLYVDFPSQGAVMRAVEGVSLSLDEGEVLGIVGESGSGKSVTMLALMGLIPYPGRVRAGKLAFAGRDLQTLSDRERRTFVGKDVAMIFQDPTTSLCGCISSSTATRRAGARSSFSSRSGFRRRRAASATTRTRCPAG
jgi:dipeptide transport system ATP-binding protein